jgi:glycerol dehydrogenase
MIKTLASPGRYIQGPGAVAHMGAALKNLGSRAFITGGEKGLGSVREALQTSLKTHEVTWHEEKFSGECSREEIERLKKMVANQEADVVAGAGGGKTLDTAKVVAHESNLPVVIIPTIAATDAPCSALSVIYTPAGVFESYLIFPKNPDLVLADTTIIARAPVRLLVSGMGDALATWFEARSCYLTKAPNMTGGSATVSALKLAELCYEQLIEYGVEAMLACEANVVTPALERIVEANTLLSGIGFESGGLAAAHGIHNGLTVLPEVVDNYHGEKVAFGTLTQLILEDADREELQEVIEFCMDVGLPTTLAELGITDTSKKRLRPVAEAACAQGETIHNMPFSVTPDDVIDAIIAADSIGRSYV